MASGFNLINDGKMCVFKHNTPDGAYVAWDAAGENNTGAVNIKCQFFGILNIPITVTEMKPNRSAAVTIFKSECIYLTSDALRQDIRDRTARIVGVNQRK